MPGEKILVQLIEEVAKRWDTILFWVYTIPLNWTRKGKAIQWILECESGHFGSFYTENGTWVVDMQYRGWGTVDMSRMSKSKGWIFDSKAVRWAFSLLQSTLVLEKYEREMSEEEWSHRMYSVLETNQWDSETYYRFTPKGKELNRSAKDTKGLTVLEEARRSAKRFISAGRFKAHSLEVSERMNLSNVRTMSMFQPGDIPVKNKSWVWHFYDSEDDPPEAIVVRVMLEAAFELVRKSKEHEHVAVKYIHPYVCKSCQEIHEVVLWEVFGRARASKVSIQGRHGKVMADIVDRFLKKEPEKCQNCGGTVIGRIFPMGQFIVKGGRDDDGGIP